MAEGSFDYGAPGRLTRLTGPRLAACEDLPPDPVAICTVVQSLVIEPRDAVAAGIADERAAERSLRPIDQIADVLLGLNPAPLSVLREPAERVVGTCRHYATLACGLMRAKAIPARARCGFATYFVPDKSADHWIVEYRPVATDRWIRVDTELLGTTRQVSDPTDLAEGAFLTGGEAWQLWRDGQVDPDTFGVVGTDHAWGISEIRGNAIRDLAALHSLEMLPWDEWGRMDDSYQGRTGPDYDELIDRVASACASDNEELLAATYCEQDLAVPPSMIG
jgi:transglutaminase superfamily protein